MNRGETVSAPLELQADIQQKIAEGNVDWRAFSACQDEDLDLFHGPDLDVREAASVRDRREQAARAICKQCPVIENCLEWALQTDEPGGVWGGANERERRRLKNSRAA